MNNQLNNTLPEKLLTRLLHYTPKNKVSLQTVDEMLQYIYGDIAMLKVSKDELHWGRLSAPNERKAYKISCLLSFHAILTHIQRCIAYHSIDSKFHPLYLKYINKADALAFSFMKQEQIKLIPVGSLYCVPKPSAYYPDKFKRSHLKNKLGSYTEQIPLLTVSRKLSGKLISFKTFELFWGE